MRERPILVIDTNTLVRGVLYAESPSGRILDGCRALSYLLLLNRPVLAEYRQVLEYEEIRARNPELTQRKVSLFLERLNYTSHYVEGLPKPFAFPRDPTDAKFLRLAITGAATHLVTHDKDLLSLENAHDGPGKRLRRHLPQLRILTADAFLRVRAADEN